MNDMSENPRIALGGNNPPASILEAMQEKYKRQLDQAAELRDAAAQVPHIICDDETEAKASELILKMRGLERALEDAQKAERKPFSDTVKQINGFFTTKIEVLEADRGKVVVKSEDYLTRKAAAEKSRLEAEAEKRRLESERLAREAAEAEKKRLEAQRQREDEERKAREAEAARAKAVEDRRIAEEAAEKARLEAIAMAERRKIAEAEEVLRRQKVKEQQELDQKAKEERDAEAAAQKVIHDKRMAEMRAEEDAAKERRRVADEEALAARAVAEEERKKQREAEEQAALAKRGEASAGRDSRDALNAAVREEKKADRIEDKVRGPDADMARTRSEHGAVSTLTRSWTYRITDKDKLDRNALWHLIDTDAIRVAVGKWMHLQPATQEARKMDGAVFEIETNASHR